MKNKTKSFIFWGGGNLKLGGDFSPLKALKKNTGHVNAII